MWTFFKPTPEKLLRRAVVSLIKQTVQDIQLLSDVDVAKVLLRAAALRADLLSLSEPKPEIFREKLWITGFNKENDVEGFNILSAIHDKKQRDVDMLGSEMPAEEGLAQNLWLIRFNEQRVALVAIASVALTLLDWMISTRESVKHMWYLKQRYSTASYLVDAQAATEKFAVEQLSLELNSAFHQVSIAEDAKRFGLSFPR